MLAVARTCVLTNSAAPFQRQRVQCCVSRFKGKLLKRRFMCKIAHGVMQHRFFLLGTFVRPDLADKCIHFPAKWKDM